MIDLVLRDAALLVCRDASLPRIRSIMSAACLSWAGSTCLRPAP